MAPVLPQLSPYQFLSIAMGRRIEESSDVYAGRIE